MVASRRVREADNRIQFYAEVWVDYKQEGYVSGYKIEKVFYDRDKAELYVKAKGDRA